MPVSILRLTELHRNPRRKLLHLPGQDVIELGVVRSVIAIPHNSVLTFRCAVKVRRFFQELIFLNVED